MCINDLHCDGAERPQEWPRSGTLTISHRPALTMLFCDLWVLSRHTYTDESEQGPPPVLMEVRLRA